MVEEAKCATLVLAEPKEVKFKKWTKAKNLRPFYIKAHMNGNPISRVLIDGGAMLKMMPYSTVKKLGKSCKDLKETNMIMSNFTSESTLALGFLIAELTVGFRTTDAVFFVVDAKLGYIILLGK